MKHLRILRHNDAIKSWCDLHSRQYRTTQAKDTCFMVYLLLSSRYQIPHRCFTSWRCTSRRCTFRTSQFFRYSVARLTNRPYVISEVNRFTGSRFVRFCSLRIDTWPQNLRHWGSLLGSSRQYIAEKATSLRELHRWGSYIAERAASLGELHRWGSLHESSRLSSSEEYWTEDTSDCCEKVLKVQPPQMLRSESSCMNRSIEFSALTSAHLLCFNSACILQEKRDFRAMNDSHS